MSKDTLTITEKNIIKKYGSILLSADILKEEPSEVIPISLGMDIALKGGIPEGSVISIAGISSSGKTTLCLTAIANAQKQNRKCYFLDVEGRLRLSLLETIPDLDISKLTIIRSTKEKFLTAEDYLNIVDQLIASDERCFIIFDSIAALCMESTYAGEIGEVKKVMGLPTAMYEFLRKLAQRLAPMKSNVIFITHLQASMSPYTPMTSVGGNAVSYFSSISIRCMSSKEIPKEGDVKTGRESTFKILKSALGVGTGDGTFYIKYNHGYDRLRDLITLGQELGFVEKAGAWYSLNGEKVQGEAGLIEYLENSPNIANDLEKNIRKVALG